MPRPVSLLMREFLAWVSSRRRTYDEAWEAWRSICPRDPVWDDALADGLIEIISPGGLTLAEVVVTARGKVVLEQARNPNG
jgi:D-3-phosphoglycerate dehydrogenase